MIFKNMEFHNVEEIIECRKGYAMQRIPSFVSEMIAEHRSPAIVGVISTSFSLYI